MKDTGGDTKDVIEIPDSAAESPNDDRSMNVTPTHGGVRRGRPFARRGRGRGSKVIEPPTDEFLLLNEEHSEEESVKD